MMSWNSGRSRVLSERRQGRPSPALCRGPLSKRFGAEFGENTEFVWSGECTIALGKMLIDLASKRRV